MVVARLFLLLARLPDLDFGFRGSTFEIVGLLAENASSRATVERRS